jgi:hypothetical protein
MTNQIALVLLALLSAAPALAQFQTPMQVAHALHMSDKAIERVKRGEVVVEDLAASSDKDLSLAIVARVDAPLAKVYEFVQTDRLLELSTVTLSSGAIDTSTFSLAGMELPDDALQRLMDEPASTFHMSSDELAQVTAAAAQGKAQVLAAYRGVLSARAKAYWEQGLLGIAPYAGEGRSPQVDLDHANDAARKLVHNPAVLAELAAVPSQSPGNADHRLYWAIEKGRDRAAPVLNHRIAYVENEGEVLIERRFYSGYDYDALQIVTGILPASDHHCAVFYTNHTYTSQVTGFGGGAKRSIGRKLMQKELVDEIERAQQALRGI